jgi:hypothetical protein
MVRTYVLLRTVDGDCERVLGALRGKQGVVSADPVEGPHDVILLIEATERQELAELTISALDSVNTMTEEVHLLPLLS